MVALGATACGEPVSGKAEATASVADPKLDTTTPKLPAVGDCTKFQEIVHHGPITVMDCNNPEATKRITAVEIVTDERKRTVTCVDREMSLMITGLKDGHLGVAHGCAGPNLTVGRCYVPQFTFDPSCSQPGSLRLDRVLNAVSDITECDPPIAADDYAGQIEYISASVQNFIDKRTGIAYCFRKK